MAAVPPRTQTLEPDVDLLVYVLQAVDEHLAALQQIRTELKAGRPIGPGGRLALALESVEVAAQFVEKMNRALT
ncbi:MAG: hypothetical protein ABW046_14015, partial [Actinoplanes sp.]